MPLKKGKSKKTISKNIGELVKSYKKKGSIGTSHPKSKKAAQKQAVAIALSKAKESFENTVSGYLHLFEDVGMGPALGGEVEMTSTASQNPMPTKVAGQGMNPGEDEEDQSINWEKIKAWTERLTKEELQILQKIMKRSWILLPTKDDEDEQSVYSNPPNGEDGHTLTPFIDKF